MRSPAPWGSIVENRFAPFGIYQLQSPVNWVSIATMPLAPIGIHLRENYTCVDMELVVKKPIVHFFIHPKDPHPLNFLVGCGMNVKMRHVHINIHRKRKKNIYKETKNPVNFVGKVPKHIGNGLNHSKPFMHHVPNMSGFANTHKEQDMVVI